MELSKQYFEELGKVKIKGKEKPKKDEILTKVHQCISCMTIYDEAVGDKINNIPPNTTFIDLPKNYNCTVCNCTKAMFTITNIKLDETRI